MPVGVDSHMRSSASVPGWLGTNPRILHCSPTARPQRSDAFRLVSLTETMRHAARRFPKPELAPGSPRVACFIAYLTLYSLGLAAMIGRVL